MSKQLVSNSEYGIDSVLDLSESCQPSESIPESSKNNPSSASQSGSISFSGIDTQPSGVYSSGANGSSIDLSGISTEAEASDYSMETPYSVSIKTDSIKSLWSASDASMKSSKDHSCVLPNDASPFLFDGQVIRYNIRRGVDYRTPVLFGSRKLTGFDGESGYNPSHFVFDPKTGTLAAGYDVNNGWSKLPNFSLITGIGNSAALDASFISGSHNRIRLELLPGNQPNQNGPFCLIPPSCAIVGGSNNNITNTSACQYSSAIIGCHNVNVRNSEATVVLGMRGVTGDIPITGFSESTFTRNLFALGHINAGPYNNEIFPIGTVFVSSGDALIRGNLSVDKNLNINSDLNIANNLNVEHDLNVKNNIQAGNNIDSQTVTSTNLFSQNAVFQNLTVSGGINTPTRSIYLEGTGGATSTYIISPSDNVDIVYANSINGQINIFLGTGDNVDFPDNHAITFKDVSLEFGSGSNYNILIFAPGAGATGITGDTGTTGGSGASGSLPLLQASDVKIEYYNNGVLSSSSNAGYVLNTSGGAVTFDFARFTIPGSSPTWVIKDQFIGNPRPTGLRFIPATEYAKSRLINHK